MHTHHSIFCITPPHMLKEVIRNGSAAQRETAVQTIISLRTDARSAARYEIHGSVNDESQSRPSRNQTAHGL